ncbi:hypothetical protein CHH83_02470 [Bacillus sp. 7586-K]|nr:hypothetical protein CHH83_02470 [Bacillus sp. 7586-K]
MNLINRYNEMVRKLNSLELENDPKLYEEVSENDEITIQDVRYMEDHYFEMKAKYKELKIGIYSE